MSLPIPELPQQREPHKSGRYLRIAVAATGITVIATVGWQIHQASERRVEEPQHFVLVDPDLLPPIPEPEKKPEIEQIEEESIDVNEEEFDDSLPDDTAEATDDLLGLDAAADAGADSFGLKAKRGGRSLVDLAGVNAMLRYAGYFNSITAALKELIDKQHDLKASYYTVDFYLWIARSGAIDRVEIVDSSAGSDINAMLEKVFLSSHLLFSPPPEDLKQPLKLRLITSESPTL